MLKITIQVVDKDSENCKIDLLAPKNLDKASKNEKQTGYVIFNAISKALEDLKKENAQNNV